MVDDFNVYKIGNRPYTKSSFSEYKNNVWSQVDVRNNEKAKQVSNANGNDKPRSANEQKIDTIGLRRNYDSIINSIEDPLSSARPATTSPQKPLYISHQALNTKSFIFPPPTSKTTFFGQSHQQKSNLKTTDKYLIDSNAIRNMSERSMCLC